MLFTNIFQSLLFHELPYTLTISCCPSGSWKLGNEIGVKNVISLLGGKLNVCLPEETLIWVTGEEKELIHAAQMGGQQTQSDTHEEHNVG